MAIRSESYLKGKFENGDRPTGTDFGDLVESTLNTNISGLSAGATERLRVLTDGISAIGDLYTTGNLQVDGNITANGTLTLGDSATDSVKFTADVNSNIIPDADVTYSLGSTAKRWDKLCVLSLSSYNAAASGDLTVTGNISGSNTSTVYTQNLSASNNLGIAKNATVHDTLSAKDSTVSGTLSAANDIYIGQNLIHAGDADTYIGFSGANIVNMVAGGKSAIKLDYSTGKIQLNNTNADLDVQHTADDGEVVLHSDAGTNKVGIGTVTPDEVLTVSGTVSAQGFKTDGGTGVTTTVAVSTNAGPQTLTIKNGIITSVA